MMSTFYNKQINCKLLETYFQNMLHLLLCFCRISYKGKVILNQAFVYIIKFVRHFKNDLTGMVNLSNYL